MPNPTCPDCGGHAAMRGIVAEPVACNYSLDGARELLPCPNPIHDAARAVVDAAVSLEMWRNPGGGHTATHIKTMQATSANNFHRAVAALITLCNQPAEEKT